MHPGAGHADIDWTPWHIALVVCAVASLVASVIVIPRLMRYYAFNYPRQYPRSLAFRYGVHHLAGALWTVAVLVVLCLFW